MTSADSTAHSGKRSKGRPSGPDRLGRRVLIEATRQLLRDRRPDEITAQEIARVAAVDARLVTYYFGSKAKLLEAVAAETILEFRASVSEPGDGRPLAVQVRNRVRTYRAFARQNPHIAQLLVDHLMLSDDPEITNIRRRTLSESVQEFTDMVGAHAGRPDAVDPRFVLVAVIAMSQFPSANAELFEAIMDEPVTEELLDAYEAFIANLVLGVGAAPHTTR